MKQLGYVALGLIAVAIFVRFAQSAVTVSIPSNVALYDPRTSLLIQDDFISGINSNGQGGALGWSQAGTVTGVASTTNRIGVINIATGAVSGTAARINLGPMSATSAVINPAGRPSILWMVMLNTNDGDTTVRLGAANSVAGNPPNDGIYFEKGSSDTNWYCTTRAGGTQTKTDSGVAIDTSFHKFGWRRLSTGVTFYIDDVAVVSSQSTNVPTTFIGPMAYIINSAAANKSMDVDYFELQITGLTR